ncbi:MAG: FAD-dependent oxidoreductase [Hyphomicrobium sp.]
MKRSSDKTRWCIVGGGMLGLALAHKLAAADREISVLETSDRLGGLADAWLLGPIIWDRHYHVALLSDKNLASVLEDIGLASEMRWTTTKTDFYTRGEFYPLNNAIDYLRFPPLSLVEKARLAFTILYASSIRNGVRLESIPVETWLTKLSGRGTYEQIWKPLLRAKLGPNHKVVSASFIWSVINRFYAARRSGLKTEMFGTVKGGYARIIERLAASLETRGVRTFTNSPVSAISQMVDGLAVSTAGGTEVFDRVIVTAPGPIAAKMCMSLDAGERERLSKIRYQGVVCASLLLKKPLRGRYLTYIADESNPFTGIIEMTAVVNPADFGGRTLVYLPTYVPADDALFDTTDDEIRARCVATLKKMYATFEEGDVLAFKVSRARHVLAIQALNYSRDVPPMETSVPGLYIVNSAQIINGNLNVDETIGLADRASSALCAREENRTAQPERRAAHLVAAAAI